MQLAKPIICARIDARYKKGKSMGEQKNCDPDRWQVRKDRTKEPNACKWYAGIKRAEVPDRFCMEQKAP